MLKKNSLLAAALDLCGLRTNSDAAEYLSDALGRQISEGTVRDMIRGKSAVKLDILRALAELFLDIETAAHIDNLEPELMDLSIVNNLQIDLPEAPLPFGGPSVAAALALMHRLQDDFE